MGRPSTIARPRAQADGNISPAFPLPRREGENVDLTLTAFAPEGSDVAVAGSFAAMLTPGGASGLVVEAEAGRTIDGNFQATIPRAEENAEAG